MTRTIAAALLFAGTISAAQAHVTLERREASPGSFYKATLTVPHGCAGSTTTQLTVTIPDGMIAVKPRLKPGWTIETVTKPYGKTYDYMHGMKISEGVREITWRGRLEDSFFDEFAFSGFLTKDLKAGETLYFPAVQQCEAGVERWVEIPAPGQSSHALKGPAPALRLVASAGSPTPAAFKAGSLEIAQPYFRATPKGASVAGGYMRITNSGTAADTLTGGSLEGAGRFEIHEMTMDNGVMRMRPLKDGIAIAPGATVELKPGGLHVMAIGLEKPMAEGGVVKGTLEFRNAGKVAVEYNVRGIGGEDHGHDHHKH